MSLSWINTNKSSQQRGQVLGAGCWVPSLHLKLEQITPAQHSNSAVSNTLELECPVSCLTLGCEGAKWAAQDRRQGHVLSVSDSGHRHHRL